MIDLEQIRGWASEAVEMAKQTGLVLDYTRGSIGALERELDVLRLNERDDAATWDLACRFGAYLGEVMLGDFKEYGYEWGEDYDGEPILVSSYSAGDASLGKILPITKCNKYLLNGPSESTAKLYAMCLSHLKGGDASEHLASLGVEPSQLQGMEPAYVRAGRFDANAAAWLLYKDYVFFRLQEISWDGTTHKMLGAQVNAAKINEIPTLVANTSLLNGLLDLMTQLEKDEGLRVPLYMIHPGVQDAIRNEDLTGITLFNLMAQAQALIIKEPEPDHYAVMCDSRLPMGIPAFYQLVARMIWDMREYNQRSGAFEVVFANARNFDADAVLGQVNERVPGAFSNAIWKIDVAEKPQAMLPSEEEARAFEPSESDPEPFITISFSDDEESDEELFEQGLEKLVREFPLVKDIEGTGYLDRIPRIEHVKVGDPLVLAADWQNEWFHPACIEVFNDAGETLGNLSQLYSYPAGNRELACLLPYITATVETVTPKSKRRKNAKYALMDVRMELDSAVLGADGGLRPEVVEEAKALLELPEGERVVLSKGGVVASQLKGNIDVGEAHDVPNPIGSTFRLWDTEAESGSNAAAAPETKKQSQFEPLVPISRRWTFNEHKTADCRRFAIEIPDQWKPTVDPEYREIARLIGDEGDESPQILCSTMIGDHNQEVTDTFRNSYIPEMRIQLARDALYSNDRLNAINRIVDDWVVEGKNCKVYVFEILQPSSFLGLADDSYEYYVHPIAYDHEDFLRLADSWRHLGRGELKELAFGLAGTVELDKPIELRLIAELDRFCEEPTDPDTFNENVASISNMLNATNNKRVNAELFKFVRQNGNDRSALFANNNLYRITAEAFNTSLDDEIAYFKRFVQALERQAEFGADGFGKMWEKVGQFADKRVIDHVNMGEDKETEREVNKLGIITIPEEYKALRARYDALKPGEEGKPSKPTPAKTGTRSIVGASGIAEEIDPEEAARRKAAEESARKADELEHEASRGLESVFNAERDGILANVPSLTEGFELAYADKPGEPFALRTRAERMNATVESTLFERNRIAAEMHEVRTKLVYAIQNMIDKRAAEEARLKEEKEARRKEEGRKELLSLSSLLNRIRIIAGEDRYCAISIICKGFEDSETISKAEAILDEAWRQRSVRKMVAAEGSFYAIGWSGNAWRAAREKESARLKAEHDDRVRELLEALGSELNEKIGDNVRLLDSIRRYTSSFEQKKTGLMRKLSESRSKLNLVQGSLKAINEEIAEYGAELSKTGFFEFRRKSELRELINQAKKRESSLRKEEKSEEERIASLNGALSDLNRATAASYNEIEEIKNAITILKRELEQRGRELSDDAKDFVRALMKLYAYPVDARWCVENVPDVNDEGTARTILDALVQEHDAIRFEEDDAYALTVSGTNKRGADANRQNVPNKASSRTVSEARKNYEHLAKEVYRRLPYTPEGHTVKDMVGVVSEIQTTQKASAVMRVAVEMGLFTKADEKEGDKIVIRFRRQARR